MWLVQVLVSWKPEGQTKNTPATGGLLGSRIWDILDRWYVAQHLGWGHIFHHRFFLTRGDGEPLISRGRRWADHRWVHSCVLLFRDGKGWDSNLDKLYPDSGAKGHTFGTRQDYRVGFTPPGLVANDVLCGRVYATYSVWLEYDAVEQHETTAQWLQDG